MNNGAPQLDDFTNGRTKTLAQTLNIAVGKTFKAQFQVC